MGQSMWFWLPKMVLAQHFLHTAGKRVPIHPMAEKSAIINAI